MSTKQRGHPNPIKARIELLTRGGHNAGMAFFAELALRLEPVEKPASFFPGGVGTVGTDGRHFFYEKTFWEAQTMDGQMFLWAHEVMHPASGHLYRRGNRDPLGWNCAGDLCINPVLKECGLEPLPDSLMEIRGADGRPLNGKDTYAEAVYERMPKIEIGCGCGTRDPNDGGEGQGIADTSPEQSRMEWEDAAKIAATNAQEAGRLPGGLQSFVDALRPKVNWRDKLRTWLASKARTEYRFLPANRRYLHTGLYLPSLAGERLEWAFVVDTSGSMADEALSQALGEVQAAKQVCPARVHLLHVDAQVQKEEVYEQHQRIPRKVEFAGRGGTNLQTAFDYLHEKNYSLNGVMVFTDGYTYPTPVTSKLNVPCIWILTHPCEMKELAKFGEMVRVEMKE